MAKSKKRLPTGFRQKKNGKLEYRFSFGGKQYSVTAETERGCFDKADQKINALKNGSVHNNDITVAAYYKELVDRKRLVVKSSTIMTENGWFKYIDKFCGTIKIRDINKIQCRQFQRELSKKLSSTTANSVFSLLKQILKNAVDDDIITKSPADGIKRIKRTEEKVTDEGGIHFAMSDSELRTFFKYADGMYYSTFFRMMLYSGMRMSEVAALKWSDIDFSDKTLHIQRTVTTEEHGKLIIGDTTKTPAGNRIIPLTPDIKKTLDAQKRMTSIVYGGMRSIDNRIFYTQRNFGIVGARNISVAIQQIEKKAAESGEPIRHIGSHCFRDTFATHALRNGVSIYRLQKLLGHTNLNMTLRYAQTQTEDLQKEADKIKFCV